jgi:hypothetical protein
MPAYGAYKRVNVVLWVNPVEFLIQDDTSTSIETFIGMLCFIINNNEEKNDNFK